MTSARLFRRPLLPLAGLLLLLGASGCAAVGPRDAQGWFEARGADVMDVVGVRVAFGTGLGAYVRATRYVQLGAVYKGPAERDLPHPKDASLRSVPVFTFGTIGRYGGAWFEASQEWMLPGWSSRDGDPLLIDREVIAGYVTPHGRGDEWAQSFGLGAHLFLVGAEAEVRPWEIVDLVAGLVGYDPSGDDVPVASSSSSDAAEDDAEDAEAS